MTAPELRDFLDDWRLSRRWSVQRFADEVGVHQSLVSKWLHPDPKRRVTPSTARLQRIAEVIGVPYRQLRDLAEGDRQPETAAAIARSELDTRLLRLGAMLARYPRPFWLAVLEASEHLAEAGQVFSPVPEPPVRTPDKPAVRKRTEPLKRRSSEPGPGLSRGQPVGSPRFSAALVAAA